MTFAADIAHLTQIAARLASPQAFYIALLTRLTDAGRAPRGRVD